MGEDNKGGNGKGVDAAAAAAASASALAAGATTPYDWVPEKYRVVKEDKSFDLEGSARKLAGGYGELNQQLVAHGLPPKDPDSYEVKELPGGLKFEEFRKDPKFASQLKGFHAVGITNKQLTAVMGAFSEFISGDAEASAEDCTKTLGEVWKTEQEYATQVKASYRAANVLAVKAGLSYADLEQAGLGNNPVFVRVMAAIGAEMKEDSPADAAALSALPGDFDAQIAAIDEQLTKLTPYEADKRGPLIDRKLKLFEVRYSSKPAPSFGG